jgi:serine/threonine protein kinase
MSPELFVPKPQYSKSVDIWSFGVLFYNMIFGFIMFIILNVINVRKHPVNASNQFELKTFVFLKFLSFSVYF